MLYSYCIYNQCSSCRSCCQSTLFQKCSRRISGAALWLTAALLLIKKVCFIFCMVSVLRPSGRGQFSATGWKLHSSQMRIPAASLRTVLSTRKLQEATKDICPKWTPCWNWPAEDFICTWLKLQFSTAKQGQSWSKHLEHRPEEGNRFHHLARYYKQLGIEATRKRFTPATWRTGWQSGGIENQFQGNCLHSTKQSSEQFEGTERKRHSDYQRQWWSAFQSSF